LGLGIILKIKICRDSSVAEKKRPKPEGQQEGNYQLDRAKESSKILQSQNTCYKKL